MIGIQLANSTNRMYFAFLANLYKPCGGFSAMVCDLYFSAQRVKTTWIERKAKSSLWLPFNLINNTMRFNSLNMHQHDRLYSAKPHGFSILSSLPYKTWCPCSSILQQKWLSRNFPWLLNKNCIRQLVNMDCLRGRNKGENCLCALLWTSFLNTSQMS